jgi:hypothetical protein
MVEGLSISPQRLTCFGENAGPLSGVCLGDPCDAEPIKLEAYNVRLTFIQLKAISFHTNQR